jgi:histidinol-phosphate phosphatase family protein
MNPAERSANRRGRPAVFIDKDGTLLENVPNNADPALVRFMPKVPEGLRLLADAGLPLFVVTNQPALATGQITRAQFVHLQHAVEQRLQAEAGVALTGWYTCPHRADAGCLCRKPASGLLRQAALAHGIDLGRSWMVGDILDDVEAGRRVGCTSVLVDVGNETVWRISPLREPHYRCTDFLSAAEIIVDQQDRGRV